MNNCLEFLSDLAVNNNREWFDAHRQQYEEARKTYEGFIDGIITLVRQFDPTIGILKAKDTTFRIFRDTRFSKDKTPYKINMGAYIARGGRKSIYAGYYVHLEPGGRSFAGGGIYMPPGESLKRIRQEIFYNVEEFKKIIQDKKFVKTFEGLDTMGDELKKAPQGYDPAWPDIELLKYKNYVVGRYMRDAEISGPESRQKIVEALAVLQPLNAFINRALEIPLP